MKRYNEATGEYDEGSPADAFIAELQEVCRKHRLSLAHEDTQGAFVVEEMADEDDLKWLGNAHLNLFWEK